MPSRNTSPVRLRLVVLRSHFTDSVVAVYGDVAIERLHYTATVRALDGETSEDVGKGIHVCTRRGDGAWQLVHDIWNSDRSPNL